MFRQVFVLTALKKCNFNYNATKTCNNSIPRVNKYDKEFYLNDKGISTLCMYTYNMCEQCINIWIWSSIEMYCNILQTININLFAH